MTPDDVRALIGQWGALDLPPRAEDSLYEVIAAEVNRRVAEEREVCLALIRHYLVYDSQRAVSWHEIQDCLEAIRARGGATP